MIEVHCENQGSLRIRAKNRRGGNYDSKLHFSFGLSDLSNPLARDLLRVGQAAFLADRAFRRGESLGQQTRRLTVVLPVEEPERWNGIRDRVVKLAEFVSQDQWHFEFTLLKRRGSRKRRQCEPRLQADSVNLFSNGLDSLCGAAAAFKRGERPIFVSHSPPGIDHVRHKIEALQEALGCNDVRSQFVNVRFRASDRDARGKRNMFPERSRRTRPMLFLSMAGAVALEFGVSRICLNENGVLSINLPFQPDQHGAKVSRHAHPETLRRFESLLKSLWPFSFPPTVSNPFSDLTKAEEIKYLREAAPIAEKTISCQYFGQQMAMLISWLKKRRRAHKNARECGLCYPCLVRRSAMEMAGLVEPPGHYVFDARRVFENPRAYRNAPLYNHVVTYVGDLYAFSERIERMSPSEFALSYTYELSLLPISPEGVGQSARTAYRLYGRFARQFRQYLEK